MIKEKIDTMMDAKRRVYPCHTNRASTLGFPCDRYCVFSRTRWEDRKVPDLRLQYIFEVGRWAEKMLLRMMEDAGIEVLQQQRDFHDKEHEISGHVDTFAICDGSTFPVEIKSMNEFIWGQIGTIDDMLTSKHAHVRKYPAQLMLYLYLSEYERGCFLFENKQTGEPNEIWVDLDYEYCEELIQKADRVNAHVKAGSIPDRIKYDPDVCDRCDFAHICLPPIENREGLLIEMEPDIEAALEIRETVQPKHEVYVKADKQIKDWAKAREPLYINVGRWFIQKKIAKNGSVRMKIEPLEAEKGVTS